MTKLKGHLTKIGILVLVLVLLGLTALVAIIVKWETRVYPGVAISGAPVLTSDETVLQGGKLLFERDSVCVPQGLTTVRRWAQAAPVVVNGVTLINSTDLGQFTIETSGPTCFSPSHTVILLPTNITPDRYVVRLESTVETPNGPVTVTSYSPHFTVKEASPVFGSAEREVARKAIDDFQATQKK